MHVYHYDWCNKTPKVPVLRTLECVHRYLVPYESAVVMGYMMEL